MVSLLSCRFYAATFGKGTPTKDRSVNASQWFYWMACKRTMKARPRKPRFPCKVKDMVQAGGGANGVTDFGDIRLLKRSIYAIGSGLPWV